MRTRFVLVLLAAMIGGCEFTPRPATVTVEFQHSSGSQGLVFDQLLYESPAGYQYSVDKFEYLITNVRLLTATGASVSLADVHYGNAFEAAVPNSFTSTVPLGSYTALSFRWGVEWPEGAPDPVDLGDEYDGMLWPFPMGRGYHCMRLEGDYTVDQPADTSFLMHMGRTHRADDPSNRVTDASSVIQINDVQVRADDGNRWTIIVDIDIDNFMNDPLFDWEADSDIPADGGGFRTLAFPTMPSHMAQELMRDNVGDVFSAVSVSRD